MTEHPAQTALASRWGSLYAAQGRALPDVAELARYLNWLKGRDERTSFIFAGLDDSKSGLPAVHHRMPWPRCTLTDLDQLFAWSLEGRGIFVTVHRMRGSRRVASDFVSARALFVDDDRGANPDPLRLAPHGLAVATSPGKQHIYWQTQAVNDPARLERYQRILATAFGTDSSVIDAARVLRVPGFDHLKDPAHPHRVRITHLDRAAPFVTEYHLVNAFPEIAASIQARSKSISSTISPTSLKTLPKHLSDLLSRLEAVSETSEGWLARCPGHDDGNPSLIVSLSETGRVLFLCRSRGCVESIYRALGIESDALYPALNLAGIKGVT